MRGFCHRKTKADFKEGAMALTTTVMSCYHLWSRSLD